MRFLVRRVRARPWLSALLALVVVVAGVGSFWWNGRNSKASAAPSYRLVAASLGTVRQSLSSSGTIEPAVQDALNFAVSGRVTSVRVTAGQRVAAGAVLATVDSASLKADLAQARASLASAQARVSADSTASSSQLAADAAAVTAAQGQVASAQSSLAEANLTSPIAGVVAAVDLTAGEQVSGSSGSSGSGGSGSGGSGSGGGSGGTGSGGGITGAGSTSAAASTSSTGQVLVISDNSWILNAGVDDTQVGLLAVGDQAEITGTTATGTAAGRTPTGATAGGSATGAATGTVYGTISSIGLIASSSSGVASYPVVIKVTGNPAGLHAGATGTVSMIYRQLANVLTVPSTAVHQVKGTSVVYELSAGKQVAHTVTVGLSAGDTTQITAGLVEGSQVVVALPRAVSRTGGTTGNNQTGFGRTGLGGGFGGGAGNGGFGGGTGRFGGGTGTGGGGTGGR